jgi:hypothetical protein
MTGQASKDAAKLDQGRNLARQLYDLKIRQLEKIDDDQRKSYLAGYPLLGDLEFNDVCRQVIEAKRMHQSQVGWLSVPHDLTVLVFVMVTWLTDWRWGAIAAAITLVVFESLFQLYFNPQMYAGFSTLVWLTYPVYALLAWVLYTRGLEWYWIVLAVLGIWGGTYLAGIIVRIPAQLYMKSRIRAALHKAGRPAGEKKK